MYRRLHPSWYERGAGGNNKVLITIWLKAKDESRSILKSMSGSRNCDTELELHDFHVTMALQLYQKHLFVLLHHLIVCKLLSYQSLELLQ